MWPVAIQAIVGQFAQPLAQGALGSGLVPWWFVGAYRWPVVGPVLVLRFGFVPVLGFPGFAAHGAEIRAAVVRVG